ncbi:MAG TPA: DUF2892 domain-containing protein [Bacteroidota bacterium]|nr:DUF2892 domain-containing protein [Bacteroidota bacterium]
MSKNVGKVDKVVRFAAVAGIAVLYFSGTISGSTAALLGLVAIVLLVTAIVGVCPLYGICGITSKSRQ